MKEYEKLLIQNKAWARLQAENDPEYFERLVNVQTPKYMWIGCSDSRVPPDKITQTQPGEIFIHRNVANLVVHTDLNLISVLQYAVEVLRVEHIIVCGHYGCGGVKAAMTNKNLGIINKWLRNIKDVYRYHQAEIDGVPDEESRLDKLIELNIREQVMNLAKTSIVQRAWKERGAPYLHGWVYSLHNGIIVPICEVKPGDKMDHHIYEYEFDE